MLAGVVVMPCESGADLRDLGSVDADGLVKGIAGDTEFLAPVLDVGGDLGVDLVGIAGAVLYVVCQMSSSSLKSL